MSCDPASATGVTDEVRWGTAAAVGERCGQLRGVPAHDPAGPAGSPGQAAPATEVRRRVRGPGAAGRGARADRAGAVPCGRPPDRGDKPLAERGEGGRAGHARGHPWRRRRHLPGRVAGRQPGRRDTGRRDTARHDTGRHDTGRHDTGRWDTGRWDGAAGTALLGRPDFLVRADLLGAPDGEPRPGELHYEVVDAKLARTAKARAVAQTAFYSHLLAEVQGVPPRWMHLALGRGDLVPLKVGDYAAYERQARRALGAFIAADPGRNPPADPYPEPVGHCVICRWDDLCQDRRRRDDDLSLVAGITKDQRRTLKADGVSTRRGLASLAMLPGRSRASRDALEGARLQAKLQVASDDEGHIRYEVLDPERDQAGALLANRGSWPCPSRRLATCSSTSRGRGTTPRTTRSSACSICSASSTRPTPTRKAGPGTRRSGPSTGRTRSGPSRS